jgi:uncharacterized membrane protein
MNEITTVASARGAAWLVEGFNYFRHSPGAWIGSIIILVVINIALGIFPLFGFLIMQLVMPVFIGGLILGCREIGNGGSLQINHLFAGFKGYFGGLVVVGLIYTLGGIFIIMSMVLVMFITIGLDVISNAINGDTTLMIEYLNNTDYLRSILLVILIGLFFYVPLLMAFWFAPALIVLDGQSPLQSMKYSFLGCLKNIMPFLIYGLVGLVLSLLATIPLMLGWLILMPMIIASIYLAYIDIYKSNAPQTVVIQD